MEIQPVHGLTEAAPVQQAALTDGAATGEEIEHVIAGIG